MFYWKAINAFGKFRLLSPDEKILEIYSKNNVREEFDQIKQKRSSKLFIIFIIRLKKRYKNKPYYLIIFFENKERKLFRSYIRDFVPSFVNASF